MTKKPFFRTPLGMISGAIVLGAILIVLGIERYITDTGGSLLEIAIRVMVACLMVVSAALLVIRQRDR